MNTQESPATKPPKPLPSFRICHYTGCRKKFKPRISSQIFHSKKCRFDHHNYGSAFGTLSKQGINRLVKLASAELAKKLTKLGPSHFRELEKRIATLERIVNDPAPAIARGQHVTRTNELLQRVKRLEGLLKGLRAPFPEVNQPDTAETVAAKGAAARRVMAQAVSSLTSPSPD